MEHALAGDGQRLTTRCEDRQVGRGLEDPLCQCGDRFDEVLAVVQDEQEFLGPEDIDDGDVDRLVLADADVQLRRHGCQSLVRSADADEFDQRDTVAVARRGPSRQLEGQ